MSPVCLLCGSEGNLFYKNCKDWEYFIPEKFDFYRCKNCNFLFAHPLPIREEIPNLYPRTYHNFSQPMDLISRFLLDRYYNHHVTLCRRYLKERNASFLEIGSASGRLLEYLREAGYNNVQGIEISKDGFEASQKKGLKVFCGTLEEFNSADKFDMVYMSHVIEHVIDPVATVMRLRHLLKPGGVLYIETPNANSPDARLWRKDWGLIHYPRHFYLFDQFSLRRMLEQAGFKIERLWFEVNSCGWALSIQNALRHLKIDRFRKPRSFYYPFLLLVLLPLNLIDFLLGGTAFMATIVRKTD